MDKVGWAPLHVLKACAGASQRSGFPGLLAWSSDLIQFDAVVGRKPGYVRAHYCYFFLYIRLEMSRYNSSSWQKRDYDGACWSCSEHDLAPSVLSLQKTRLKWSWSWSWFLVCFLVCFLV
jgi:hypothetical protein